MRNAILTAILLGVLCAVVGSYLIVQGMGLLGNVISHAVLPGLTLAQVGAFPPNPQKGPRDPPSLFSAVLIFSWVLLFQEHSVRL